MLDSHDRQIIYKHIFGKNAQRILRLTTSPVLALCTVLSAASAALTALTAASATTGKAEWSATSAKTSPASALSLTALLLARSALTTLSAASTGNLHRQALAHDRLLIRVRLSRGHPILPAPLKLQNLRSVQDGSRLSFEHVAIFGIDGNPAVNPRFEVKCGACRIALHELLHVIARLHHYFLRRTGAEHDTAEREQQARSSDYRSKSCDHYETTVIFAFSNCLMGEGSVSVDGKNSDISMSGVGSLVGARRRLQHTGKQIRQHVGDFLGSRRLHV